MSEQMSDSEKIELLYTLYEEEMFRICHAVLNDTYAAEDAVSESFLKLIKTRDRIADPRSESCRRYALKIAKNTSIDMYRRNAHERCVCEELPDNVCSIDGDGVSGDGSEMLAVREMLSGLSKKYRDVVECICIKGLSAHEASAVLKISEACVRKRLERARRQLEGIKRGRR